MEDLRVLWRKRWLHSLQELTSIEIQKKCWLVESNLNLHNSFVEFMCSYFDDLSIDDNYRCQLKNNWVTSCEFEFIKEWHILLSDYNSPNNEDYNHNTIINDPKWLNIVDCGNKGFIKLRDSLSEEEFNDVFVVK